MRDSTKKLLRPASYPGVIKRKLNSKTSLASKVSSILSTCRICLSSIFNAATLRCGHSYCERCLGQYWRVSDKPDCIVCPLCRTYAFDVNFSKEQDEGSPSTQEFRTVFTQDSATEAARAQTLLWGVKFTALMPILYCLFKWLQPYILELLSCAQLKFTNTLKI